MDSRLGNDMGDKMLPIKDLKISVNFINELKSVLKQIESRLEKNEENAHKDQNTEKEKINYKNDSSKQETENKQIAEISNIENTPISIDEQEKPLNINATTIHISNANQINFFNVNENVFSNVIKPSNSPNDAKILENAIKADEIKQENTKKEEEKQEDSPKREKEILYDDKKSEIYIDDSINKGQINSNENFLAHDEKNAETDTDEKSSCKNDENYGRINEMFKKNKNKI